MASMDKDLIFFLERMSTKPTESMLQTKKKFLMTIDSKGF